MLAIMFGLSAPRPGPGLREAKVILVLLAPFFLLFGCGSGKGAVDEGLPELQGGAGVDDHVQEHWETPAATPERVPAAEYLLPDLATEVPDELVVRNTRDGRELRFSTTVSNVGPGPMEIHGALTDGGTSAIARQVVQRRGGGEPAVLDVGTLHFDSSHGHWHLERFLVFELWRLDLNGNAADMLASTEKISFCLVDHYAAEDYAPVPTFTSCDWTEQGISPGWNDRYNSALPGQRLDLNGIGDGHYLVRMVIDPDGLLVEQRADNNAVEQKIELRGDSVAVVP